MRIKTSVRNLAQDLSGHMLICAVVLSMLFMATSTVWSFNGGSFPDRQTYLASRRRFLQIPGAVGSVRQPRIHEVSSAILATRDSSQLSRMPQPRQRFTCRWLRSTSAAVREDRISSITAFNQARFSGVG